MTRNQLKLGLHALGFAFANPKHTFFEYFPNPFKVLEQWQKKSSGLADLTAFKLSTVPSILEKMGDEESKEAYLKELCYQALSSHSLAYASSLPDILDISLSNETWDKRKQEALSLEFPYEFLWEADKELAVAHIYPQYEYKDIFTIEANEVILDCGAYIGDTDLYFEKKLNDSGKIYAFEPQPQVREVLERNIKKFGKGKIEVFPLAASDKVGKIYFSAEPSGGSGIQKKSKLEVDTVTLDGFCLNRTDAIIPTLIKMDIEGSELLALEGARGIIQQYLPKLAICTYHSPSHLWKVPEFIMSCSDAYTFYFKKHHPNAEAVLYAIPNK